MRRRARVLQCGSERLDRAAVGTSRIEERGRRAPSLVARRGAWIRDELEDDRHLVGRAGAGERVERCYRRERALAQRRDNRRCAPRRAELAEHPRGARSDGRRDGAIEEGGELGDGGRACGDERVADGRAQGSRGGVFLRTERPDERADGPRSADAAERDERGLPDTGRALEGERRDRLDGVGRAEAAERRERLDLHLGYVVAQREEQRLRGACVAEVAERTNDGLADVGDGVLHLSDERHDRA